MSPKTATDTTTITIRSDAEPAADDRRAARRGLLRRALRAVGGLDRSRDRLVRPAAQSRDELSTRGGADRGRAAGGDPRSGWGPSSAGSSSPRSIPAPSRSTRGPPAARGSRRPRREIAKVEQFVRETIGEDLQIIISELGVVADLSAAYTPNAGPMDAVVKVQLKHEREHSAQEYVAAAPQRARPGIRSSATWSSPSTPAA